VNLFDALFHPDQEEDPDCGVVIHAANLLEVGEFQLLQLAFFEWYGREMHCSEKESFFRSVFLVKETPVFLRHYARNIVLSDDRGDLRARVPFYHRYDPAVFDRRLPNGIGRFVGVTVLLISVLIVSLGMAIFTIEQGGRCTNYIPPCLTAQDLGEVTRVDSSQR
jgi:hypothetical protein